MRLKEGSLGIFGQVFSVRESRYQAKKYAEDLVFMELGSIVGVAMWEAPVEKHGPIGMTSHRAVITTNRCPRCLEIDWDVQPPDTPCPGAGNCYRGLRFGERHILKRSTTIKRRLHVLFLKSAPTEKGDFLEVGVYMTDPRGMFVTLQGNVVRRRR